MSHIQVTELFSLHPTLACLPGIWAGVTLGQAHRVNIYLVTFLRCRPMAKKVGRSSLHTSAHNEQEKVKHILKKIF